MVLSDETIFFCLEVGILLSSLKRT